MATWQSLKEFKIFIKIGQVVFKYIIYKHTFNSHIIFCFKMVYILVFLFETINVTILCMCLRWLTSSAQVTNVNDLYTNKILISTDFTISLNYNL